MCKPVSLIDPYGLVPVSFGFTEFIYDARRSRGIRSIDNNGHMLGTQVNRDVNRGDVNMYMAHSTGYKRNLFHTSCRLARNCSGILLLYDKRIVRNMCMMDDRCHFRLRLRKDDLLMPPGEMMAVNIVGHLMIALSRSTTFPGEEIISGALWWHNFTLVTKAPDPLECRASQKSAHLTSHWDNPKMGFSRV